MRALIINEKIDRVNFAVNIISIGLRNKAKYSWGNFSRMVSLSAKFAKMFSRENFPLYGTVCVQIFAGRIFRECPLPDNFRDFNFAKPLFADKFHEWLPLYNDIYGANEGIFAILFSRMPANSRNSRK